MNYVDQIAKLITEDPDVISEVEEEDIKDMVIKSLRKSADATDPNLWMDLQSELEQYDLQLKSFKDKVRQGLMEIFSNDESLDFVVEPFWDDSGFHLYYLPTGSEIDTAQFVEGSKGDGSPKEIAYFLKQVQLGIIT